MGALTRVAPRKRSSSVEGPFVPMFGMRGPFFVGGAGRGEAENLSNWSGSLVKHKEQLVGRTTSAQLPAMAGRQALVMGWLQSRRSMGGVTFYVLRDGWGTMQVVGDAQVGLADASLESAVSVIGDVVAEDRAPGGVEIRALEMQVIAGAETLPFVLSKRTLNLSLPMMLDHAALSLRHPQRRVVFRLADRLMAAFREVMRASGFTEIQTPKLTGGAAEGGANLFSVDYFGREAYLAQSPQLYKQMMVGVYERVFEVGPVFRAEPHDTARHLNQYTSLDAEMGFIRDHTDVMGLVEGVVSAMVRFAQAVPVELDEVSKEIRGVRAPKRFPVIQFSDALQILGQTNGPAAEDLAPHDEMEIARWAREEHGSDFVFVTGFPLKKRPFYTHPDPECEGVSRSFDLLFRGLEIVTGGQRLHRYPDYLRALGERGLSSAAFVGYLESFRWGMPPHGGFGMGLERFVMKLLGLGNVREAALFPRTLTRLDP